MKPTFVSKSGWPRWLFVAAAMALAVPDPVAGCEAGVCNGTVTDDGRTLSWKLRIQVDVPNDVHYFAAGQEHHAGLGPAQFSYLGVGPHDDTAGGPARVGVNAAGLTIGFNAFNEGDWKRLDHYALGFCAAAPQVRTYLLGMTNLGTIHYVTDVPGHAVLWENDRNPSGHWEYDTRAESRFGTWRDFDGDGEYIPYAGWVGRANAIDRRSDGLDEPRFGEDDRTAAAQTVPARLVDSDRMSVRDLAVAYFRHDALAVDTSVSSTIIHGVLPTEDARLTTLWTALGHAEGAIFVPTWIHGVESGGVAVVPDYLDFSDGDCAYVPAKGLINSGADEAALQARTLPVEAHFFDVVLDELLPAWRRRFWGDTVEIAAIGREMRRVQERMDADAYSLLDCLYRHGVENHAPLGSGIDGWRAEGLTVSLAATTLDDDGTIAAALWDYGDGQTGTVAGHTYDAPDTYLVSYTVTDDDGVSFTDWEFVDVADPQTSGTDLDHVASAVAIVSCFPNPCNPETVITCNLPRTNTARLSVIDLAGRRVRALAEWAFVEAGPVQAVWDGRDDRGRSLPTGSYLCLLESGAGRAARLVMLVR